jgi:hypothetical protein
MTYGFDDEIEEGWNQGCYVDADLAQREDEDTWLCRLPWLTEKERSIFRMGDHPGFPGAYASDAEYDSFALQLRRSCKRVVPCQFRMQGFNIRGAVDLVSGHTYMLDDGRYVLIDDELQDVVDIQFDDNPALTLKALAVVRGSVNLSPVPKESAEPMLTLFELLSRRSRGASPRCMGQIVEALEAKNALPPIEASVRGQLDKSFYPF